MLNQNDLISNNRKSKIFIQTTNPLYARTVTVLYAVIVLHLHAESVTMITSDDKVTQQLQTVRRCLIHTLTASNTNCNVNAHC